MDKIDEVIKVLENMSKKLDEVIKGSPKCICCSIKDGRKIMWEQMQYKDNDPWWCPVHGKVWY